MADHTRKDRIMRRLGALKTEFESFQAHYEQLAQFVDPRRGRFFGNQTQRRNRGGRSFWNQIINSQATWALRVATAGIFNGIMSPARPWFMLETDDPGLLEFGPAKEWFFGVQEQMQRIFTASNLYDMAPMMLREKLLFGTGCMSHMEDSLDLCRFYTHTVGSYYIAQGQRFTIDTVYREFDQTVGQMVEQFSTGGQVNPNISSAVRRQYDLGNYDTWFPMLHVTEPNEGFRIGSLRPNERLFSSVYIEPGNNDRDSFLGERGFNEFPFYVPRFETTNEDVYATNCPGMTALGDVRQLQFQEKRKAQGIDKTVAPPLHGPAVLRNQRVQNLPAGGTFYDAPGTSNELKPIYEVRLPLDEMIKDMDRVEGRINRAFLVDLFLAISAMEGVQPRNQLELTQRNQERLLQLGPALQRDFTEFLDPLISRTFNQMVRAGIVAPPPPDLQRRPLKVRYVSTLAMAQQAVSTGNIDRVVGFAAGLAESGWPNALDKINPEQAVDEYGALIGAPPTMIRGDDEVTELQEARAQELQRRQQLEMTERLAAAGRQAGDMKLTEDTLAGQAVRSVGGSIGGE